MSVIMNAISWTGWSVDDYKEFGINVVYGMAWLATSPIRGMFKVMEKVYDHVFR